MPVLATIEDDGYLLVTLRDNRPVLAGLSNQVDPEAEFDTFETFNRMNAILDEEQAKHKADGKEGFTAAHLSRWQAMISQAFGGKAVSQAFAVKVYEKLNQEVTRLEKKSPSDKPA